MLDHPKIAAAISAILFGTTMGALIAVAGFGIIRLIEQMGVGLGMVPARWGENNPDLLMLGALVVAAPLTLWFTIWIYKKALTAEIKLQGYVYVPPAEPKLPGKA